MLHFTQSGLGADLFKSIARLRLDAYKHFDGVVITSGWGVLEPELGLYDLRTLERAFRELAAIPKKAWLTPTFKEFNFSATTDPDKPMPANFDPYAPVFHKVNARMAPMWAEPVRAEFVRLLSVLRSCYDSNGILEVIDTPETAPGKLLATIPGYNEAGLDGAWDSIFEELSSFSGVNAAAAVNFYHDIKEMVEVVHGMSLMLSLPDAIENDGTKVRPSGMDIVATVSKFTYEKHTELCGGDASKALDSIAQFLNGKPTYAAAWYDGMPVDGPFAFPKVAAFVKKTKW